MARWNALFSHRIVAGTLAGYYGQFVQLGVQLISLPVFTAHWGLAGYGTWLIMFTIPSSLALADFGMASVGGNTMTAASARGEFDRARAIYASLRMLMIGTGTIIACAVMAVLLVIRPHSLDFAQGATGGRAVETAWLLVGYGFIALVNEIPIAAARAADAYAPTIGIRNTIILAEATSAMTIAILGHGLTAVAWAYFLTRLAGSVVLNVYVISRAAWLRKIPWRLDRGELRALFAPAMAALVLPGANAVITQGAVIVIGSVSGPATVPVFTAVRTVSRIALQFAFGLNYASMPRYTALAATENRVGMDRLVLLNMVATALVVVPAAGFILLLGKPFIAIWTHGLVHPPFLLLGLMVTAMLLNASWLPLANLIMAINRHAGYSYFFLASGTVAMGIGILLQRRFGVVGMACALVLHETAMVNCVWRLGTRVRVIPRRAMAESWRFSGEMLRQLRLGKEIGR
ncbi:MAG: hypothetical protein M3N34_01860 [Pseudomonadota bacterium]|nr:hypothetical protein [Pseudomonadota bacterium]